MKEYSGYWPDAGRRNGPAPIKVWARDGIPRVFQAVFHRREIVIALPLSHPTGIPSDDEVRQAVNSTNYSGIHPVANALTPVWRMNVGVALASGQ